MEKDCICVQKHVVKAPSDGPDVYTRGSFHLDKELLRKLSHKTESVK